MSRGGSGSFGRSIFGGFEFTGDLKLVTDTDDFPAGGAKLLVESVLFSGLFSLESGGGSCVLGCSVFTSGGAADNFAFFDPEAVFLDIPSAAAIAFELAPGRCS